MLDRGPRLRYAVNVKQQITSVQTERDGVVYVFSNFVEYPVPPGAPTGAAPYLYFTLGVKHVESGLGFVLLDVRLSEGRFQNPYHKTAFRSRAHGYLNAVLAQGVERAWLEAVAPLLPSWRLSEGAWEGLVFDVLKLSKSMDAPYKVWTKDASEKARREKAERKVGIV